MKRRIQTEIERFYAEVKNQALLITGARQTGKTYIVREFGKTHFDYFIEINFLENKDAVKAFESSSNSEELLVKLSALTDIPMVPHKTLIFFDEVQECKEIVTAIKFLIEEGSYSYIMSGSLLGVELKDIKSVPVGYMKVLEMYPMDFFEFCEANHVSEEVIRLLEKSFHERKAIDPFIHDKLMSLFRLYLVVGGMPAAVQTYLDSKNIKNVIDIQKGIVTLYKRDIAKYDPDNKLYLEDIYNLIPSELNSKNKRFILKKLNENFKPELFTVVW